jgi:hypothetical protein
MGDTFLKPFKLHAEPLGAAAVDARHDSFHHPARAQVEIGNAGAHSWVEIVLIAVAHGVICDSRRSRIEDRGSLSSIVNPQSSKFLAVIQRPDKFLPPPQDII